MTPPWPRSILARRNGQNAPFSFGLNGPQPWKVIGTPEQHTGCTRTIPWANQNQYKTLGAPVQDHGRTSVGVRTRVYQYNTPARSIERGSSSAAASLTHPEARPAREAHRLRLEAQWLPVRPQPDPLPLPPRALRADTSNTAATRYTSINWNQKFPKTIKMCCHFLFSQAEWPQFWQDLSHTKCSHSHVVDGLLSIQFYFCHSFTSNGRLDSLFCKTTEILSATLETRRRGHTGPMAL